MNTETAIKIAKARAAKVEAMVDELDKLLARVATETGLSMSPAAVVEMLRGWNDQHWASLAVKAGKRPPKTSRPLVIAEFVRRSKESAHIFCRHGVPSIAHCRWCADGSEPEQTVELTEEEREARRAAIRADWATGKHIVHIGGSK